MICLWFLLMTQGGVLRIAVGVEDQRRAVDAVAQTGRRRSIGEHMAQMGTAPGAAHFGAHHAVAVVFQLL